MMPQKHSIDFGTGPHQWEGVCTHPRPLSRSRLNTHTHARVQTEKLLLTQMQNVHKYAFMWMNIHVEIFPGDSGYNAC